MLITINLTSAITVLGLIYFVLAALVGFLAIIMFFMFVGWRVWMRITMRTRAYRGYHDDLRLALKVIRQVKAEDRQARFNAAAQRLIAERDKTTRRESNG